MQSFEQHLTHLTQSRERIAKATTSALAVARCGGAKRVVDAVMLQIKEPVGSERRVALFYLLDSILHHAQRAKCKAGGQHESIAFLDLVESKLKELVEVLCVEYDSYTKMEKVLELWKERQLFKIETMDTALEWLHAESGRHARAIEDDRLRSQGMTPYYIRDSKGPKCKRIVLSRVFATAGRLSEYMSVPESLAHKGVRKYERRLWDIIDSDIKWVIEEGEDTTTEEAETTEDEVEGKNTLILPRIILSLP